MRVLCLLGLLALLLPGGCVETKQPEPTEPAFYSARADHGRIVVALEPGRFDPELLRQRVPFETEEAPGTIIVDTANFHLYLVEPEGWALRYGVAIGREGFGWTGSGHIERRAKWPRWVPPAEMIARDPSLKPFAEGMAGGPRNPLGARALYIYQGSRDTLIRVHGTNTPGSIGQRASSGCFRMLNQDVIDLYSRVPDGARIVVM